MQVSVQIYRIVFYKPDIPHRGNSFSMLNYFNTVLFINWIILLKNNNFKALGKNIPTFLTLKS